MHGCILVVNVPMGECAAVFSSQPCVHRLHFAMQPYASDREVWANHMCLPNNVMCIGEGLPSFHQHTFDPRFRQSGGLASISIRSWVLGSVSMLEDLADCAILCGAMADAGPDKPRTTTPKKTRRHRCEFSKRNVHWLSIGAPCCMVDPCGCDSTSIVHVVSGAPERPMGLNGACLTRTYVRNLELQWSSAIVISGNPLGTANRGTT